MKILFELAHTAEDYEILKADHDFEIVAKGWDVRTRPKPEGIRFIEKPGEGYDVVMARSHSGFDLAVTVNRPIIYGVRNENGQPKLEIALIEQCEAVVFTSTESILKAGLTGNRKAILIERGIDSEIFASYRNEGREVLTVSNSVVARADRGPDVLEQVGRTCELDLLGFGNEGSPHAIGPAKNMLDLACIYQSHRVYFNPCGVIGSAVLEAMATGMPVVTMRPTNYVDLMAAGVNCLIANSTLQAIDYIKMLLANYDLRAWMGANARKAVMYRFHPAIFRHKWNALLQNCHDRSKV